MAPYPALYSVEAVIWPSVIFLLSIPRGSEHAMHREDVVISRDYSASLNSIVLHDYCFKDLQFGCLLQGSIFIFLSESSAGQVSLMVYLPGYNLGTKYNRYRPKSKHSFFTFYKYLFIKLSTCHSVCLP